MIEILRQPWPWWVSGPLLGLTVPVLLLLGIVILVVVKPF